MAVETALADRAVAALLIYETADGKAASIAVPNLESIRHGLLHIASWGANE